MLFNQTFSTWLKQDAKFLLLHAIVINLYGFLLIQIDKWTNLPYPDIDQFLVLTCIPIYYSITHYSRITSFCTLIITGFTSAWTLFFLDISNYYHSIQTLVIVVLIILCVGEILYRTSIRRKKAEEMIKNERDRAQQYLDIAGAMFVSLDVQGRVELVNQNTIKVLEYSKDEIIGKNWFNNFLPEKSSLEVKEYFTKLMRDEADLIEFHENSILTKSGAEKIIAWHNTVLRDNQNCITGILSSGEDITELKRAEEKFKKQQRQHYLEKAQELGQIGTWELDLRRNTLYWTDENCRIFGVQPGTVVNYEIFIEKVHPDDREYVNREWNATLKGKPYDIDHRLLMDGNIKWVREKADIEFDEEGAAVNAIGFTQDITARKHAEEALSFSEEMFRSTMNNLLVGVIVHAADSSIILSNPQANHLLGLSSDQLQNKRAFDQAWNFVYEDMSLIKIEDYPISKVIDSKERLVNQILGIIKPDCEDITWVNVNAVPIFTNDNVLDRVIVNFMDITERKWAEEALRENEAKQSKMVANIGDVIVIIDKDGINQYKSINIERWFGWKPEELVGRSTWENVYPDDLDSAQKFIGSLLSEPNAIGTTECRYLCKDGSYKWIEFTGVNLLHDPDIRGILGNYHDITERKQAEEELLKAHKLESIGILAGGIAHDFNNLLMAIMGNISLARSLSHSPDEVNECLSEVDIASQRAQKLTQQLLTFSKGGAPIKESANAVDLVKETTTFSLRGSNISCNYSFPDNLWQVDVDKGQFSQVIQNLVINADQAMPDGGTIDIKGENISISDNGANSNLILQEGDYVKLYVQDRGIGISEEHLKKIFDPYFTTKRKGNGLGLATTYSIIKNHGGHIAVESQIGKGTTFTLYIPRSTKENIMIKQTAPDKQVKGQGRILIMDDDETIRKIVSRMLENIGYQVDCSKDGTEAIEKYTKAMKSNEPFNAVIMDLTIPGGMGGKDAIQLLIEIDPQVKAFVSSGYSGDPVMANYQEYGFSGVISKPYKMEELEKVLWNAIH